MTSSSHIKPWLLGWTQQLRGWAEDGSLLAAAQQALLLEGEPKQLVELLDQWGASDFSALPAVETLSSQDIAGARGAYVEDLSQIFLNQEWLAEASDQEISAVLTEELGHHLDAVLNDFDTPGDEGELFSAILDGTAHSLSLLGLDDDQLIITVDGIEFEDEASSPLSLTAIASITDGVGGFDELNGARGVTTTVISDKTYALVASKNDDGLQIIDISTPASPTSIASITDGSTDGDGTVFNELHGATSVTTVDIGGSIYALVAADYEDGLQIIDISTPASPKAVASITDGGTDGDGNTFDELHRSHSVTTVVIGGSSTYALVDILCR